MSTLAIINTAVFDGESDDLTAGPVLATDGVITEVGGDVGDADVVIDARGGTVLPGLIDAHFHAYAVAMHLMDIEMKPLSYVALNGAKRLGAALRRGFTTVRDVAGGDAGFARAINEGLFASPRYLYTGPALSQTGGHGDSRAADSDVCGCHHHMNEVVDGVDPLRRAVRERFLRGAHAIKIMTSGGVVSLTDPIRIPQYSAEEVLAVTGDATRRGSYVAAHAYSPEAIKHSVLNGVRSIEHGNLLDAEAAALMADRGAFLVPTLVTYDAMGRRGEEIGLAAVSRAKNREVLDAGRTAVELARSAGVRIGFGTDLMGALEDEQLAGLRLQLEVDGALATLRSATSVNADLLGRSDLGRLRPGAV
ncbi:MAG TPA: amidohydrolase family protein, partial [Pseudonocardiaceae bacterium]|nr:amidohydrolase family protein [Pseudonocardiaceae bacterium]